MGSVACGGSEPVDWIRADVFLDLLAGVDLNDTGSKATVDIRVDIGPLMGVDDKAADIPGSVL